MNLSWAVLGMVVAGALAKSSSDKALDTALIHLVGSVLALPLVVCA